jgi:hypothetical protein
MTGIASSWWFQSIGQARGKRNDNYFTSDVKKIET